MSTAIVYEPSNVSNELEELSKSYGNNTINKVLMGLCYYEMNIKDIEDGYCVSRQLIEKICEILNIN